MLTLQSCIDSELQILIVDCLVQADYSQGFSLDLYLQAKVCWLEVNRSPSLGQILNPRVCKFQAL